MKIAHGAALVRLLARKEWWHHHENEMCQLIAPQLSAVEIADYVCREVDEAVKEPPINVSNIYGLG